MYQLILLLISLLIFSYKDDVGMTRQHRQILRRNVDSLHRIDLEKLVAHLSALLDDEDKQNLLNTAKPSYQRVDMLLTEVLPRRGPTAFHSFVQGLEKVDPSIAQSLQQDAGIKGIMITRFIMTLVFVFHL